MQYPLQHPHLQVQNIRTFTVCQNMLFLWASLFLLCTNVNSFNLNPITKSSTVNNRMAIFMGRAAAVRAATKAKTDMAKTKNNARYGKKIAIAIKAGGADPLVNRNLAQVIAEAKAAQVPNDVIKRNLDKGSTSTADYKQVFAPYDFILEALIFLLFFCLVVVVVFRDSISVHFRILWSWWCWIARECFDRQ